MTSIASTSQKRAAKCVACGLPLEENDILDFNKSDLKNQILNPTSDLILCRNCTNDYSSLPIFKLVLFSIAYGYFINNKGIKDNLSALKQAFAYLIQLPYWKTRQDEIVPIENTDLINEFKEIKDINDFINNIFSSEQSDIDIELPDIFISHSWKGPDAELVEPLVKALKERGYNVWYDKEMGIEPGNIEEYLKDAIMTSKNCIPIICKQYFEGKYTHDELVMLYNIKEQKHIIPVWFDDVDKDFLKKQGELGRYIIETTGITWKNAGRDINILADELERLILSAEDIEDYNGAKLYASEVEALQKIEKIIGKKIPQLPESAYKDMEHNLQFIKNENLVGINNATEKAELEKESNLISLSKYNFGFAHENNHVIALILSKPHPVITSFGISGRIIFKLKHLRYFAAPLTQIPAEIGLLKDLIELNLDNSICKTIPDAIKNLRNIRIFSIKNNKIEYLNRDAEEFIGVWIKKHHIYPDVHLHDAIYLYLLEESLNLQSQFPNVSYEKDPTFGYSVENERITGIFIVDRNINFLPKIIGVFTELKKLDLYDNKLSSLPESIGNLKNLKELVLRVNQLSSLPESIGNLKNLTYLNLGGNNLSSLLESIGSLTNLKELDLSVNKLSSLPESIGSLTNLIKLDLSYNKLSSLPESIGNLFNLTYLDLESNELSSLPKSIGKLKNLKELVLQTNLKS
ncbi:MAG: leucine-rich repeat domain-containing protein [Promethearchaeota archaeon]